jgi:hypothetical protein
MNQCAPLKNPQVPARSKCGESEEVFTQAEECLGVFV